MHASTLELLDGYDEALDGHETAFGQPKREKFRQSLGKVHRARAAERRGGRSKSGSGRRRHRRVNW